MEPENLLVLEDAVACCALEPGCEALVELGSQLLGHRVVGGIPDEQMPEPVRILAGEVGIVGPHKLLSDEALEVYPDLATDLGRREVDHGSTMEDLSLDRGALDHRALNWRPGDPVARRGAPG